MLFITDVSHWGWREESLPSLFSRLPEMQTICV